MIFLFTDFGAQGPYLGQLEAALLERAHATNVINLLSDAPAANPRSSSYLLAALANALSPDSIFVCVVDPGVGGSRPAVVLEADGRRFVGPENGLLNTVALHARDHQWSIVEWRPKSLSASFHGRDLFAPLAARIAKGEIATGIRPFSGPDLNDWRGDIDEIVYIDHYGNAVTGRRYTADLQNKKIVFNGRTIVQGLTFVSVAEGQPFWYKNSCGLVEIAVNLGRADRLLELEVGSAFRLEEF